MRLKKVLVIVAVAAVGVSAQSFAGLSSQQDKLSYAMGFEAGQSFKTHDVNVNSKVFTQGMTDGLKGSATQMTQAQVKQTLVDYQKQMIEKFQAKIEKQSTVNHMAQVAFMIKNAKVNGMKQTQSGLQYRVITKGSGASPTKDDSVTVNYKGMLLDGKVFDSSYKRGKPATFQVKAVIPGWQEALELMRPGATWELYIPAKLAYGKMGAPGMIPPNSMLKFKVHLIKVSNKK